ncbi:MAG: ABC transporter ATP-binding protein [Lachnospiraceae bacterium]|nr:ABC transporter ATP-binding protein [Lachnospiraceae bacterium]
MREQGKTICVKDLNWQPEKERQPVLDGLEFTLEAGNFYGILGANGSGKTSLMRHLLRLYASKNSICLGEKPLEEWKQKALAKMLSYVPQNTVIEVDFTVEEIVMMGRTPYRKRFEPETEQDKQAVLKAMQWTNCEQFKDKSVTELSGGEVQRVVAARAIAQETEWIFLDEPTSHLDLKHQIELMDLMQRLCQEKGVTIVAVLHDVNLALQYCTHLLLMKNGKLCAAGKSECVGTKEELATIYEMEFEELKLENGGRYLIPVNFVK